MIYIPGALGRLSPVYLETLCLLDALLRLGFTDMSVCCSKIDNPKAAIFSDGKTDDMFVCVRIRNLTSEFTCAVGPIDCPAKEFPERWGNAFRMIQVAPPSEAKPIWEKSRVKNVLPNLVKRLREKGFVVDA